MNLIEVKIKEIKNIDLIYIFTTDSILKGKSETYIGAKVVFDKNRTLSLDYRSPYFESFIRRLIERYHKEKDNRTIILLGNLTEKIIEDKAFKSLEVLPDERKETGISLFDTRNFELKKYESFFVDTLENIMRLVLGYEVVKIDRIDGYNNKFVIFYHVGTVEKELRLIISFRDDKQIDFTIAHADGKYLGIKGTINNEISYVSIDWESQTNDLKGYTVYDTSTGETEKKIVQGKQTYYYSEESDAVLESDHELIAFYLKLFGINIPKNLIKTSDYNYLLGDEDVLHEEEDGLFIANRGVQISISDENVLIRVSNTSGLSKYKNRINVALSKNLTEFVIAKLTHEGDKYILIEQKDSNDFDVSYQYRIYPVENFAFKAPFTVAEPIEIKGEVDSLEDVKRYIKMNKGVK